MISLEWLAQAVLLLGTIGALIASLGAIWKQRREQDEVDRALNKAQDADSLQMSSHTTEIAITLLREIQEDLERCERDRRKRAMAITRLVNLLAQTAIVTNRQLQAIEAHMGKHRAQAMEIGCPFFEDESKAIRNLVSATSKAMEQYTAEIHRVISNGENHNEGRPQ